MTAFGSAPWAAGALVMALVLTGPVSAQQPTSAQQAAIRSACRADYQSHCASVPTGGSAALQCLMQNAPSLSPGCQQALSAVQGGGGSTSPAANSQGYNNQGSSYRAGPPPPATIRQACSGDYGHYCRGIPPGGGRALACLQSNQDRLSQSCRGALAGLQSQMHR